MPDTSASSGELPSGGRFRLEDLPVVHFKYVLLAKNVTSASSLAVVRRIWGNRSAALVVHLHLLAVVAGQVQVLPYGVVQGAGVSQLLLPLLPLRQGPDLGALAVRAGNIKLGDIGGVNQRLKAEGSFSLPFSSTLAG